MSDRDWTISEVATEIFWVESYFIAVDALLGMPVWEHSTAAPKALERGIIRKITRERAQELNAQFAGESEHSRKYLEEQLEARWKVIAMQSGVTVAAQPNHRRIAG